MNRLLKRFNDLSRKERELVLKKLRNQKLIFSTYNEHQTSPILAISRSRPIPLSYAQQRLWFLNQLEPENPCYNIHKFSRFTGILNITALEQAFNEVLRRHEVLRTTFSTVDGEPVQIIRPETNLDLAIVDLRGLSEAAKKAEANRLASTELQRPFDLLQGPLLHCTLLHMDDKDHILLPIMHHIVSDCWSMEILHHESVEFCKSFSAGKPSSLPEFYIQYADFAHWQRQCLQGKVLEKQLSFWKQQLAGKLPVLELPTDRPRPPVQTFRGATHSFTLPESLSKALKTLSRQENVTIFMTLLAAFKLLLHRCTGQDDIVVGTLAANRNRSEIEALIGFFTNILVLRTDFSGNPSFQELLGRVRKVALGAYAHQELPFEKLVKELQPEQYMTHSPLFQVMFILQNVPVQTESISRPFEIAGRTAKYDLTLCMWETPNGLAGTFEYNTNLFDITTIIRMYGHLRTLLEGIVADPGQCISTLPLLSEGQRKPLLLRGNLICPDYPFVKFEKKDIEQSLPERFDKQVNRCPDKIAIKANLEVLPPTSNGKVDTKALPVPDRTGTKAGYIASRTSTEEILAGIWADVIGLERVGIYDNFFELGGDSLLCFQVANKAAQIGLFIAPYHLFQYQTIAELSEAELKEACFKAEQNAVTGPVPLTPIQHWLIKRQLKNLNKYCHCFLLEGTPHLTHSTLKTAMNDIWAHHDMLRMRIRQIEQNWEQIIESPEEPLPYFHADISRLDKKSQDEIVGTITQNQQDHFDITKATCSIVLFYFGYDRPVSLLLTLHHLNHDVVSIAIMLEHLNVVLRLLTQGKPVQLPLKTTSFKSWALRLRDYAQSTELRHELNEYWLKLPWEHISELPVDYPGNIAHCSYLSGQMVTVSLDQEQTKKLREVVQIQYGASIEEILIAGICQTISKWTAREDILIDLTNHGRDIHMFDDIDISRTVGYFVVHVPIIFHWSSGRNLKDSIHSVISQYRRIPSKGIGFGLLSNLCQDKKVVDTLKTLPRPQIKLLYQGHTTMSNFDSLFFNKVSWIDAPQADPHDTPCWLLNFHAGISNESLKITCKFIKTIHSTRTVNHLLESIIDSLKLFMT